MTIYDEILADHETARRLLSAVAKTADDQPEQRTALFSDLKIDLMMHQHAEEAVFYAFLKEQEATRQDALEAINEHHVVDALLEELDDMPKAGDEWRAKFGVLEELVEHHMEEEEGEFFEHAKQVIDGDLANRMGRLLREKKDAGVLAMKPVQVES